MTGLAVCPPALAGSLHSELVSIGPGGANMTSAEFLMASADGRKAFLATGQALVPEDDDGLCPRGTDFYTGEPFPPTPCVDIYERDLSAGTTKLVSTGPAGATGKFEPKLAGVSSDGSHVFFETREPLVAQDTDSGCIDEENNSVPCIDVYERSGNETKLVSTGPGTGNGAFDAKFGGASADGSRVFFTTSEPLTPDDSNTFRDVYERTGGVTSLVSTGPAGGTEGHAGDFKSVSADGTRVFFETFAPLVGDDRDFCPGGVFSGCNDVYERDTTNRTTELVSTGPQGGQAGYDAHFAGATPDGLHAFFTTTEPLLDEDGPIGDQGCVDVYERAGGVTRLVSTGPKRTRDPGAWRDAGCHGGSRLSGFTPDGSSVFFTTMEQLVDGDTDGVPDVYERTGLDTTLLSVGPNGGNAERGAVFWGASEDGSRVFIGTDEQLLPEDINFEFDIYERAGGTLSLLFFGPIGNLRGAPLVSSPDGGFFFETTVRLVPEDPDTTGNDVYKRLDGQTNLVSKGSTGASSGFVRFLADEFRSVADRGRRFFFEAFGRLTAVDTDSSRDIYVSIENEPPSCADVTAAPSVLLPANGQFRLVSVAGATDPDGDPVTLEITAVTQDEPVGKAPDAAPGPGSNEVLLRAKRDPKGDGRVYRVAFRVSDGEGGSCEGVARVAVPRQRKRAAADSAPPGYDSFGR